eukprot:TRINITY_DN18193_c0_g5_i1.p2 TRINITY_DN18193_c0_g5~~TRINITY_DN18193_c0_g5_i1.p2  ORF type:complete len:335 (-),score=81.20 TRINITY_DN18193_c0_g5_i1:50-1015(-)
MKDIIETYESGFDIKHVNIDDPLALDQIIDTFDQGSTVILGKDQFAQQKQPLSSSDSSQQPSSQESQSQTKNESSSDEDDDDDEIDDFKLTDEEEAKLTEEERQLLQDYTEFEKSQREQVAKEEHEILQFLGKAIRKGWGKEQLTNLMQRAVAEVAQKEEEKAQKEQLGLEPENPEQEQDEIEKLVAEQNVINPYTLQDFIAAKKQQLTQDSNLQTPTPAPTQRRVQRTPAPTPTSNSDSSEQKEEQKQQQEQKGQVMFQGEFYDIKELDDEEQDFNEMETEKQFDNNQEQQFSQKSDQKDSGDGDSQGYQIGQTMTIPLR